jgi:exopolyphosphatase/guanosine-5'-triphosphate,3'-diphosphate pyrophosphatase
MDPAFTPVPDEVARPRLAALDIGSNSIRLVVAEVEDDGSYRVLDDERETTRLSEGLSASGRISEEAIVRSLAAIGKMKAIADGLRVTKLRAIATSAVREAENGHLFCERVQQRFQVPVETISGEEEARLAFHSVVRHFHLNDRPTGVIDIGGGSLEVILAKGTVVDQVYSLPLGAVRVTERFDTGEPLPKKERRAVIAAIDRELLESIGRPPLRPQVLIGSGGTFTTLAEIQQARRGDRARTGRAATVQGYRLSLVDIERTLDELMDLPVRERRNVPGLPAARADIIVAGTLVVSRLAQYFGCPEIWVHEKGIRDGLLLEMIAELPGGGMARPKDRFEEVRRFARKCGCRESHCDHVAALAVNIFDGLKDPYRLSPEARDLLLAAGMLHEAGHLISQKSHHKHAYHVLLHSELPGFTAQEIEIIANLVRYHRGGTPKESHANFRRLRLEDALLVKQLAGILRVADALDRTRFQRVKQASAQIRDGEVHVLAQADGDAQVELWAAEDKKKLFQKAYGMKLKVEKA